MRIMLIIATLLSLTFANEAQKEMLAKKHDNMMKKPVEERVTNITTLNKFSKEELKMEQSMALSAGSTINEDIKQGEK